MSANAAEFGVPPPGTWPPHLAVYAPGPGTAEALAALGIDGVRVPATTLDSAGLLALPELAQLRGKRVVIFRGDTGREELAAALSARGAAVDQVPCYSRLKPSGTRGLDDAFAEGRIDAVTLTSSEGLDNLWSQVAPATRSRWARCRRSSRIRASRGTRAMPASRRSRPRAATPGCSRDC